MLRLVFIQIVILALCLCSGLFRRSPIPLVASVADTPTLTRCFDEENMGVIQEDRLRELLTTMGDRFTDDDVDEMLREAPIRDGLFDYVEFTRILKHGAKDKDEQ